MAARGQVATEFFVYSGVFLFMAVAAFAALSYTQSGEVPAKQAVLVEETGRTFADNINLAVAGGDGYEHKFVFGRTIYGKPFEIDFEPRGSKYMIVSWDGDYGSAAYTYLLAGKTYEYRGCTTLAGQKKLVSSECSNTVILKNENGKLIIEHVI